MPVFIFLTRSAVFGLISAAGDDRRQSVAPTVTFAGSVSQAVIPAAASVQKSKHMLLFILNFSLYSAYYHDLIDVAKCRNLQPYLV